MIGNMRGIEFARIDFDIAEGHRYLRFSFAGTAADIEEGLARLRTVV